MRHHNSNVSSELLALFHGLFQRPLRPLLLLPDHLQKRLPELAILFLLALLFRVIEEVRVKIANHFLDTLIELGLDLRAPRIHASIEVLADLFEDVVKN